MLKRVLSIAGSDCSGGAGIQADLKTITVLGGYGMSVVSALTAQNTQGVYNVLEVPAWFVNAQLSAIQEDIGIDSVKIGMLHRPVIARAVGVFCQSLRCPVVIDPVMVSKSGECLLKTVAVAALKKSVIPHGTLLTPNIPEASVLTGLSIENEQDMMKAAEALKELGVQNVLMKGGHGKEKQVVDILLTDTGMTVFRNRRLYTPHTHGTGCTLSAALATYLAYGASYEEATRKALEYVHQAIASAPGIGKGRGPLHHTAPLQQKTTPALHCEAEGGRKSS